MSATTTHLPTSTSVTNLFSLRWIINAREDLIWFIGSVTASYLLLALYAGGVLPLVLMLAVWAILFDAPHIFATLSRTYFDREERASRKRLLIGSLLFFFVGPLLVFAGAGLFFFFIAALWAYYHLVKQHYGFMVLYKKKNDDLLPVDNALDRAFLLLAFAAPFLWFAATDAEAQRRVPNILMQLWQAATMIVLYATIAVGIVWLARQAQRIMTRKTLNVPKLLLLAAAIPMHWIVLLTPMPNKPIAIVAILTIYHNLQYTRLVWFHNQKYKRGADDERRQRFGAAATISRSLLLFILFGVLFGLSYRLPQAAIGRAGGSVMWTQAAAAFFWGFAFMHYYLDSKIWRVRRDPSVGKALQMETAQG